MKTALTESLYDTGKTYLTFYIHSISPDEDYVCIQIDLPTHISVSDAVQQLIGNSSLASREQLKFIREMYLKKDGIWSGGYFTASVGLNGQEVKKCIAWPNKKDQPQTTKLF